MRKRDIAKAIREGTWLAIWPNSHALSRGKPGEPVAMGEATIGGRSVAFRAVVVEVDVSEETVIQYRGKVTLRDRVRVREEDGREHLVTPRRLLMPWSEWETTLAARQAAFDDREARIEAAAELLGGRVVYGPSFGIGDGYVVVLDVDAAERAAESLAKTDRNPA